MRKNATEQYHEARDEAQNGNFEILSNAIREAFLAIHEVAGEKESELEIMESVVAWLPECVSLAMSGLQIDGFFDSGEEFSDDAAGDEKRTLKLCKVSTELTKKALARFMERASAI